MTDGVFHANMFEGYPGGICFLASAGYQGLYTMHRHGLDTFTTDSSDRQLYFFQVQRNGDKVEANVVKSVQANNALSTSDKNKLIQLHHAVGQRFRDMAATDAQNAQPKDRAGVLQALQEVCQ